MVEKKIRIRPIGDKVKTVKIDTNWPVKKILEAAGFTYSAEMTIIGNGDILKGNSKIGRHEEIIITPAVGGG